MTPGRLLCVIVVICMPALFVCAGTLSRRAAAQERTVDATPGVRNAHVLVYESTARRVLMLGGADDGAVRGDMWAWDSVRRTWSAAGTLTPGPRTFPAAAFDDARREVVLFGGNRVLFGRGGEIDTFLDDTWTFAGGRWRRRDGPAPAARAEAAMVYDRRRRRVVLFGGYRRTAAGVTRLNDTWEWDGVRWHEARGPGPGPRSGMAAAYDEGLRRAVIFGGSGRSNETWSWDGRRWERHPAGDPDPRFNAVMSYSRINRGLIRFGGYAGDRRWSDTWLLQEHWRRLDVAGPAPRNHAAMVADPDAGRLLLFGGHEGEMVFGDTWEWDGRAWIPGPAVPPRPRLANGH